MGDGRSVWFFLQVNLTLAQDRVSGQIEITHKAIVGVLLQIMGLAPSKNEAQPSFSSHLDDSCDLYLRRLCVCFGRAYEHIVFLF